MESTNQTALELECRSERSEWWSQDCGDDGEEDGEEDSEDASVDSLELV